MYYTLKLRKEAISQLTQLGTKIINCDDVSQKENFLIEVGEIKQNLKMAFNKLSYRDSRYNTFDFQNDNIACELVKFDILTYALSSLDKNSPYQTVLDDISFCLHVIYNQININLEALQKVPESQNKKAVFNNIKNQNLAFIHKTSQLILLLGEKNLINDNIHTTLNNLHQVLPTFESLQKISDLQSKNLENLADLHSTQSEDKQVLIPLRILSLEVACSLYSISLRNNNDSDKNINKKHSILKCLEELLILSPNSKTQEFYAKKIINNEREWALTSNSMQNVIEALNKENNNQEITNEKERLFDLYDFLIRATFTIGSFSECSRICQKSQHLFKFNCTDEEKLLFNKHCLNAINFQDKSQAEIEKSRKSILGPIMTPIFARENLYTKDKLLSEVSLLQKEKQQSHAHLLLHFMCHCHSSSRQENRKRDINSISTIEEVEEVEEVQLTLSRTTYNLTNK